MSNEKQENKNELTVEYEIEGQKVKLTPSVVQQYIVGTKAQITVQEFKFFTELCKVRKLNPFLREAYLIKYDSKIPAQLVVGKDAILKRAVLNSNYDGIESGVIIQKEDGTIEERQGTFRLGDEQLVGGWARVFRKDWSHPTYASVSFNEVAQKKNGGQLNSNWSTKGATMVEKVAKVRALRETFVEDLGGMYEAEEVEQDLPEAQIIEVQEEMEEQVEEPKEVSMNEL